MEVNNMASIGFSLGTPMGKLSAQDMGVPDYVSALSKGFDMGAKPAQLTQQLLGQALQNKINTAKAKYAEDTVKASLDNTRTGTSLNNLKLQQLRNTMNQDLMFQDELNRAVGGQGYSTSPQASGQYNNNYSPNPKGIQSINDYSDNNMPAEGPGVAASGSAYDTFPGRRGKNNPALQVQQNMPVPGLQENISSGMKANKQILNEGNPSLYGIDEMYDKSPRYRKKLEALGYKKTQTTKYDSKTGAVNTITTLPSGKTEFSSTQGSQGDGSVPLTNNVKTYHETIVSAAPQAIKMIDDIIAAPSPVTPSLPFIGDINAYRPGARAEHAGLVALTGETLQKALGFTNTNEGLHQALTAVDRKTFESDSAYRERLNKLKDHIKDKVEGSKKVLKGGVSTTEAVRDASKVGGGELNYNPKTGRLE